MILFKEKSKLHIQTPRDEYTHFVGLATFQGVMKSISDYYSPLR